MLRPVRAPMLTVLDLKLLGRRTAERVGKIKFKPLAIDK